MKICLVGECLSGGGAERVQAILSDFFTAQDIEVHHVIFISRINYAFSGRLLNLGEVDGVNLVTKKINRFMAFYHYVQKHRFHAIIDSRVKHSWFQEFFINRFIYNRRTFFLVHSFNSNLYFPEQKWLANVLYSRGKRVIAVSDGIKDKIKEQYGWNTTKRIFNPINSEVLDVYANGKAPDYSEYILFVGRMDKVKQLDKLLETFAVSHLKDGGVKLVILGEGKLQKTYKKLAEDLGINESVVFEGFQTNPYVYMKNAKFLVLCSEYEGFGNVLVESLATGTPVISFDCHSGPREIIQHETNGLLVQDQDFNALREAMERFYDDDALYAHCKSNARKSVAQFFVCTIGQQWLDLVRIKRKEK